MKPRDPKGVTRKCSQGGRESDQEVDGGVKEQEAAQHEVSGDGREGLIPSRPVGPKERDSQWAGVAVFWMEKGDCRRVVDEC